MRKPVILLLVFLLPVSVFLFLRYFGKNEFDIPVFYADELPSGQCGRQYALPYLIPDSIISVVNPGKTKALLVMDTILAQKDLSIITENFAAEDLTIFSLSSLPKKKLTWLKNCVLFLNSPHSAVLIDRQRQIRGYYVLPDREEMDKLDVELKILLKKY